MGSDVYFVKTNSRDARERINSLQKILETKKPFSEYEKDNFIPIKLTIGDAKCVYNINPDIVKIIVQEIKKYRARPFLFDTNVIYKGSRLNAVDHLTLVQNKGFCHSRVGAPFIIADGLFGQDGKEYKLNSGYIKNIKVPSFIGMVDKLVVLSHVTCHILSGYAGAIKNIAMGMACRPTKQVEHSSLKPRVIRQQCTACGCCVNICPANAISLTDKAVINQSKCIGCGECLCACKFDAILINWHDDANIFVKRMVDVASFVLSKFKNKFFINFAFDITKECDCISTKNEKIICSDIGILASNDILALDRATVDLINKNEDVLKKEGLKDSYKTMFEYADSIKLGSSDYNLIVI